MSTGRWGPSSPPGTTEQADAETALALARLCGGQVDDALSLWRHALALGRRHHHAATMFRAAAHLMASHPVRDYAEAHQLSDELPDWPREGVPSWVLGMALFFCATIHNCRGDRGRGEELSSGRSST
jgi:hypothetical protein